MKKNQTWSEYFSSKATTLKTWSEYFASKTTTLKKHLPSQRTANKIAFTLALFACIQIANTYTTDNPETEAHYRNLLGDAFNSCKEAATHYAACLAQLLYNPESEKFAEMREILTQQIIRQGADESLAAKIVEQQIQNGNGLNHLPAIFKDYVCPAAMDGIRQTLFSQYAVPAEAQATCEELMDRSRDGFEFRGLH